MRLAAIVVASLALRSHALRRRLPAQPHGRGSWRHAALSAGEAVSEGTGLSVDALRTEFPALDEKVNGVDIVYLDSAATSQKPRSVLGALNTYYESQNANVHRGAHTLAVRATEAYEGARDAVARFINAESRSEVIFTRGASEAINLVAATWGEANIGAGDVIVLSVMEHHSNLVPWQLLAERKGAEVKYVQLTEDEQLDLDHLDGILREGGVKLVAMAQVSNTLGCLNPVDEIALKAHAAGAKLLVDACQSVPHMPVDVQEIGCDFLVASGHKMCGPTGIGFLWGRYDLLDAMPPYQSGGEMIDEVFFDRSTFAPPPAKFEAGTPAIAQAVGLGAAIAFLEEVGMERVHAHERELAAYLEERLLEVKGLRLYGPRGDNRVAALGAFNIEGAHASDLAFFLDQEGVACRAGHHCTQPLHRLFGAAGSLRASCYLYNTREDVDKFMDALRSSLDMLGVDA